MKPTRRIHWWQLILAVSSVPIVLYAFSSGPPSEHTGGFGEATCTECHIGTALNGGQGSVTVTIRDSGGVNVVTSYASEQTYQITVRVADPQRTNTSQSRWGFELSARTLGGQQAGSLTPTNNQTQLVPTFNGIQYITHTTTGTRAGTTLGVNFTFNWTAPNVSVGPVIFHAAGNAANNSQSEIGDRIYSTSLTIQPQASGPTPSISDGGVVNIASNAPEPAPVAPGSVVAISGLNLTDGSQNPAPGIGSDGKLLTTLGGASVAINGISAPIVFAFPGLLGVQIPYELAGSNTGSVVVTMGGQSSTPHSIALASASPGIFTLNQQGTGQGGVLIGDTTVLAAPTGSSSSSSRRPAKRGEVIRIYCTGLGAVTPAVETGALAGSSQTSPSATVTIDGLSATVQYSGTAPGFVGLYQIDAMVPGGASIGDAISLVVSMGGQQSNTVTIAVGP
ncbi:MAG: hypothetical protein HY651_00090 [Acidobacteria bacterium]|nr:hypothetical protein [Acidobacteriota bacterium]